MKKILMALLMGSLGYLAAAAHTSADAKVADSVRVLSRDQYVLLPVEGADPVVNYREGSKHRMLQPGKDVTWDHRDETSTLNIRYFLNLEAGKVYLSAEDIVTKIFPHVDAKPESAEERANVLWKFERSETRVQQNHRFVDDEPASLIFSGTRISQWRPKGDTYRIYVNTYTIRVVGYEGIEESAAFVKSVRPLGVTNGDTLKKRRGGDLFNSDNYSGQGSAGEEPRTPEQMTAKFKELFPQYAHFF